MTITGRARGDGEGNIRFLIYEIRNRGAILGFFYPRIRQSGGFVVPYPGITARETTALQEITEHLQS